MRTIATELVRATIAGQPAAAAVPVIPADASDALREGLRRRRVAATLGRCACGATRQITAVSLAAAVQSDPDRPSGHIPFNHAGDCPAHDDLLGPEVERWQTRR